MTENECVSSLQRRETISPIARRRSVAPLYREVRQPLRFTETECGSSLQRSETLSPLPGEGVWLLYTRESDTLTLSPLHTHTQLRIATHRNRIAIATHRTATEPNPISRLGSTTPPNLRYIYLFQAHSRYVFHTADVSAVTHSRHVYWCSLYFSNYWPKIC